MLDVIVLELVRSSERGLPYPDRRGYGRHLNDRSRHEVQRVRGGEGGLRNPSRKDQKRARGAMTSGTSAVAMAAEGPAGGLAGGPAGGPAGRVAGVGATGPAAAGFSGPKTCREQNIRVQAL